MAVTDTNLDYLLPMLRFKLGDIDNTNYRYLDEWLLLALVGAVEALSTRWNYKYLLEISGTTYDIIRNPHRQFIIPSPPLVQQGDERPIVLMASVLVKEGSMENASWSFGSWRDSEIAYSNIESSKAKDASLKKDIDELNSILGTPKERLAQPTKGSLPGYKGNIHEQDSEF